MDKIARLRQEIENSIKAFELNGGIYDAYEGGELAAYKEILAFLDTLEQQEPEGLDEAAKLWVTSVFLAYSVPDTTVKQLREIVEKTYRAGAEWAFGQGETHEGVVGYDFIVQLDRGDWIDLTPDVSNQPSFDVKPGDKVIVQIRKK